MATYTPNLNLTLPGLGEPADVTVLNNNFSDIDAAFGERQKVVISANSSETVYLDNGGRYTIIINGTPTTVKDFIIVSVSSNGAVNAVRVANASNITLNTSSSGEIGITNNATNDCEAYVSKLN